MKKVDIRKDIYALFEEFSGKPITKEIHEKLKESILAYTAMSASEVAKLNETMQKQGQKIKEMSKIIYHRGWDAEILEKHIGFLKVLFEEK